MPGKSYSREQKTQAVALARVRGVEQAALQLGLDARAVRRWVQAAGVPLGASTIDADDLVRLERLAHAQLEADVAAGRIKGTQLATVWGIVKDKIRLRDREQANASTEPRTDAEAFVDTFEAWALEARPDLIVHYGSREGAAAGILRALLRAQRMWEWERAMAGQPVVWEDATNGES